MICDAISLNGVSLILRSKIVTKYLPSLLDFGWTRADNQEKDVIITLDMNRVRDNLKHRQTHVMSYEFH